LRICTWQIHYLKRRALRSWLWCTRRFVKNVNLEKQKSSQKKQKEIRNYINDILLFFFFNIQFVVFRLWFGFSLSSPLYFTVSFC
jgi:hypothetical protein